MLASTEQQIAEPIHHPRRPPAHLSVSLRHENSPIGSESGIADANSATKAASSPNRQDSEESSKLGESSVQRWFENSNTRPEVRYTQGFEDNDPPYFVSHNSSSTSNNDVQVRRMPGDHCVANMRQATTLASSTDDFRSVIDDLTIENRKLKERLRRYERSHPPQLEKDKMFEVKIHGLPSRKKRELEEVLRRFASSIEESADEDTKPSTKNRYLPYSSLNPQFSNATSHTRHTPSSTTSNSRPNDSAYASMSNSGPTSTSTLHQALKMPSSLQPHQAKEQNIHSFLHNIPEGLLPKHPSLMTERQKKKIVVQRLEQLFTGKGGVKAGVNSQPFQQQEVSNSAARADQATSNTPPEEEGSREAHILGLELEGGVKLSNLLAEASSGSRMLSGSSDEQEQSPERSSPRQRPTRPLDLDPDRAQIPSENVEYIRHLGLSTPKLVTGDSADVAADAEGWIYLNLLINMAQLHIINVTPEFVRAAVSEVSEKFQLSPDRKKVRWRGGSEGTHMSSDSGESSVHHRSPQESENDHGHGHTGKKRRKIDLGRFASTPVEAEAYSTPLEGLNLGPSNSFHYKPLFRHQKSSSVGMMSTGDSDSPFNSGPEMDMDMDMGRTHGSKDLPWGTHAWSGVSHSIGTKRRRHDDGPIVFYSGATFCTDLSGDRGNILAPLHVFGIGKDGYSNQAQTALGSAPQTSAPAFTRTTSGSLLPYRPFKDYSKGNDPFQTKENRPKTPELFNDESDSEPFVLERPPDAASGAHAHLQDFEASGLGGIQPMDHFAVHVQTRRRKPLAAEPLKLSRFSRLSSPNKVPRKFLHHIPQSSIESFQITPEETITKRLAAWPGVSSPPRNTDTIVDKQLIKTEILSARHVNLAPSQLPPPLGWIANLESSDDDSSSEATSSSAGVSRLQDDRTFLYESHGSVGQRNNYMDGQESGDDDSSEENESSDTNSDIDMLAHVRRLNPYVVAEQERTFAMQVDGRATEALKSSAATINDESGCSSAISLA